jgi:hypothetical protein
MMTVRAETCQFVLQRDCVREAAGYLSFPDDWKYNPAIRFRRVAESLSDSELGALRYPSTAVQLLLGGNIWPQAQYLNFVRHSAFFFIDLLDDVSFEHPAVGLSVCADRIDARIAEFREMFTAHEAADELHLPQPHMLSYWGGWYLPKPPTAFHIRLQDDPRPYHFNADKLRDLYHYESVLEMTPSVAEMLVANTGFTRNVKASVPEMPVPIACAETCSAAVFAGA